MMMLSTVDNVKQYGCAAYSVLPEGEERDKQEGAFIDWCDALTWKTFNDASVRLGCCPNDWADRLFFADSALQAMLF